MTKVFLKLAMSGLEPETSGVLSDHSAKIS